MQRARNLVAAASAAGVLVLAAAVGASANTFTGKIFTVAGNPEQRGFEGDGGQATKAKIFWDRKGVSPLPDGGFLFADVGNNRVRKVSPDGVITTVAGNGQTSYNLEDGRPATETHINSPKGVAVLPDGGFLIADTVHRVVLKVASNGAITRVAGQPGGFGYRGDNGPATEAPLENPVAVAVLSDGGFLIVDAGEDEVVRRVSSDGIITTVAGISKNAYFYRLAAELAAAGAALPQDANGDTDTDNPRIQREFTLLAFAAGVRPPSGDGGPANQAILTGLRGAAALPGGGFLIAERSAVRKVDAAGNITTVAGGGNLPPQNGQSATASAITPGLGGVTALADGGFLVSDDNRHQVYRVSPGPNGVISILAGKLNPRIDLFGNLLGDNGDGGPAVDGFLNAPSGIGVTADGRLLVAEGNDVRLVDTDLRWSSVLQNPFDPQGALQVGHVATLAGAGPRAAGYSGDGGWASLAHLNGPSGVSARKTELKLHLVPDNHDMAMQGRILIADTGNNRIRQINPDGRIWTVAGNEERGYFVRDANGDLVNPNGQRATEVPLNSPFDVTDLPNGGFLIADTNNNRIRYVDAGGTIETVAGTGVAGYNGDLNKKGESKLARNAKLDHPHGVSVIKQGSSLRGYLIADTNNHIIRSVNVGTLPVTKGRISTVVGRPNDFEGPFALFFPEKVSREEKSGRGTLYITSAVIHWIYKAIPGSGIPPEVVAGTKLKGGAPDSGYNGDTNGHGIPLDPTEAKLDTPLGILATKNGFIFADSGNDRVREVKKATVNGVRRFVIDTLVGDGKNSLNRTFSAGRETSLNRPAAIAKYKSGILIAEENNNAVRFLRTR